MSMKILTKWAATGLALGLLWGCSSARVLTPDEQAYVTKIMALPTDVTLSQADAVDAWGRAQSFIGKYSMMKLQSETDFIIQTYTSPDDSTGYATDNYISYNITKTPMMGKVQISVQCTTGNLTPLQESMRADDLALNAHILSYYIATGELPFPDLIAQ
jgi:hypothetical protein